MSEKRIKRPKLERTRAIRDWSTLFAAPAAGAAADRSHAREPAATMSDIVSRSVDLGYRVIDDYIRQGQKAAQRLGDRSYGAAAMTRDASELTTRMTQYASDFTTLWLEFLQVSGAGMMPRPPLPASNGVRPPSPSPADPPRPVAATPGQRRIKVAVVSPYPTEVSLDLAPEAAHARVAVQSLRAAEADKPRLSEVAIEESEGGTTLRIRVPEGQPAGVYEGLVVDEQTSRPVGTVTLRIERA